MTTVVLITADGSVAPIPESLRHMYTPETWERLVARIVARRAARHGQEAAARARHEALEREARQSAAHADALRVEERDALLQAYRAIHLPQTGRPRRRPAVSREARAARASGVGEKLRQARLDAGLTQTQAALGLGRPQSYISKCEGSRRELRAHELVQFALLYRRSTGSF